MVLNPTNYLTSQGWSGPGTGFTPTSRSKPITIIHKKNQSGIGKERDSGYAWWDDVFSRVASKVAKPSVELKSDIIPRTITGLVSPLPPPISQSSSSSYSQPLCSNLNLNAMDCATQNAARRDLYRRFLRGSTIIGTVKDDHPGEIIIEISSELSAPKVESERVPRKSSTSNQKTKDKSHGSKKRKRKRVEPQCEATSSPSNSIIDEVEPEETIMSVNQVKKTKKCFKDTRPDAIKHKKKRKKERVCCNMFAYCGSKMHDETNT